MPTVEISEGGTSTLKCTHSSVPHPHWQRLTCMTVCFQQRDLNGLDEAYKDLVHQAEEGVGGRQIA